MAFSRAVQALTLLLALDSSIYVSARPALESRATTAKPAITTKPALAAKPALLKGGNLRMIPANKFHPPGFTGNGDFNLKDSDSWFFGQQGQDTAVAVLAGTPVNPNTRFLSNAQFSTSLKQVKCDNRNINLSFKDKKGFDAAQKSWGWLVTNTTTASRSIVFIGDENCGTSDVALYSVSSITYDAKSFTAKMTGQPTEWKKVLKKFAITVDSGGLDARSKFTAGFNKVGGANNNTNSLFGIDFPDINIPLPTIDKEADVAVNVDFSNKNLFSKQFGNNTEVALKCNQCGATGSLHFRVFAQGQVGTDTEIKAGVEFDAKDLAINLGLGLKLAGKFSVDESQSLPGIPLLGEPIGIPGLASFGPTLVVGAAASLSIEASVELGPLGGKLSFPENPHAELSIGGDGPKQSGWNPQFDPFTPQITGQVDGKATLTPFFALGVDISASAFDLGASAGIVADVPRLDLGFKFTTTTAGGVCNDPKVSTGVSLNAKIGGELNLFAGKKPIKDARDIKVFKLVDVEKPIFDQCFPIAGGVGGSGGNGGDGGVIIPALPGKVFVKWFKDAEFTGGTQQFFSAQDGRCQVVAPDFQNAISSLRVDQSSTGASGGCIFYRDDKCAGDSIFVPNETQNQNIATSGVPQFNDAIKSWKCCNDVNNCTEF